VLSTSTGITTRNSTTAAPSSRSRMIGKTTASPTVPATVVVA
jgi:hypothetical protein